MADAQSDRDTSGTGAQLTYALMELKLTSSSVRQEVGDLSRAVSRIELAAQGAATADAAKSLAEEMETVRKEIAEAKAVLRLDIGKGIAIVGLVCAVLGLVGYGSLRELFSKQLDDTQASVEQATTAIAAVGKSLDEAKSKLSSTLQSIDSDVAQLKVAREAVENSGKSLDATIDVMRGLRTDIAGITSLASSANRALKELNSTSKQANAPTSTGASPPASADVLEQALRDRLGSGPEYLQDRIEAQDAFEADKFDRAKVLAAGARDADPDKSDPSYDVLIGTCELRLEDPLAAVASAERALARDQTNRLALLLGAAAHSQLAGLTTDDAQERRHLDAAIAFQRRAVEQAPREGDSVAGLTVFLNRLGLYEESIAAMNEFAIGVDASVDYQRAATLALMERDSDALVALKAVVKSAPDKLVDAIVDRDFSRMHREGPLLELIQDTFGEDAGKAAVQLWREIAASKTD